MRKLLSYLESYKLSIAIIMVFAVASTVYSIVGPKILGKATTKLFEGVMAQISGSGGIDFNAIGKTLLLVIGFYILSAIYSYIQGWIMTGVSMKITYRFRRDISQKINRLPFGYFDGTTQGEVLSRITNDVDTVSQTLNQSLSQAITSVTTVIGVVAMMLSISWMMTLVILIILPLSFVLIKIVVGKSQIFFQTPTGLSRPYKQPGRRNVWRAYGGESFQRRRKEQRAV